MLTVCVLLVSLNASAECKQGYELYESESTANYVIDLFLINYDSAIGGVYVDTAQITSYQIMQILLEQKESEKLDYTTIELPRENMVNILTLMSSKHIYYKCFKSNSRVITCSECPMVNSTKTNYVVLYKNGIPQTVVILSKETFNFGVFCIKNQQHFYLSNSCINSYYKDAIIDSWFW